MGIYREVALITVDSNALYRPTSFEMEFKSWVVSGIHDKPYPEPCRKVMHTGNNNNKVLCVSLQELFSGNFIL